MTRLTNSGLSITEWEPIMGIFPPTSAAEWQDAFEKYKSTYEYRFVNMNMTLDEFRYIFNWEWRHRLLARLVFLSVFLPFIVFLLAGRLSKAMQTKIFVVLGLIVLQGFVGWFMVQSGLRSEVRVSPYRLALHLGLASLLFAMLVALALSQDRRELPPAQELSSSRFAGRVIIGLLFGLILFGALVAGLARWPHARHMAADGRAVDPQQSAGDEPVARELLRKSADGAVAASPAGLRPRSRRPSCIGAAPSAATNPKPCSTARAG